MNIKPIAQQFSIGKFEPVYEFLSEEVTWEVKGASAIFLDGKEAVIEYCTNVAKYFASVETKFSEDTVLVDGNKVAITGSAKFSRDGNVISLIDSCDVFLFDSAGKLMKITSYCIQSEL